MRNKMTEESKITQYLSQQEIPTADQEVLAGRILRTISRLKKEKKSDREIIEEITIKLKQIVGLDVYQH